MITFTHYHQNYEQIPYWVWSCIVGVLMFYSSGAHSQSVSPDVADASSYKFTLDGTYVDMSFGEFAISTLRTGDQIITQGFLQPISVDQPCAIPELVYYPNPVVSTLTIEALECDVQIGYVEVFDLFGKDVLEGEVLNNTIDLSVLGVGVYIIRAYNTSQQVAGSLKIVKITA